MVMRTNGTFEPSSLLRSSSNFSRSTLPLKSEGSNKLSPSLQSKSTGVDSANSKLARVVSKWLLLGIISPLFTHIEASILSLALP